MLNLKDVLNSYNIQEFKLLSNNLLYGSPNRTLNRFLIQSKNKRYILKVYSQNKKESLNKRVRLLIFLKNHHFPTSYLLQNMENNYYLQRDQFLYTLENYIPFQLLKRPEFISQFIYAQKIADIYKKFQDIPNLKHFYKKYFKQVSFINKIQNILADIKRINNEIYHIFYEDFEFIHSFLDNIINIYEPAHGDFHPMNMLFNSEKTYLIDWEFTNLHIKYYDLAILFGCIFADSPDENGIKFIEKILMLLDVYNDKSYILQLSYISRVFWLIEWLKNKDIEALKWEKYVFYALKDFI